MKHCIFLARNFSFYSRCRAPWTTPRLLCTIQKTPSAWRRVLFAATCRFASDRKAPRRTVWGSSSRSALRSAASLACPSTPSLFPANSHWRLVLPSREHSQNCMQVTWDRTISGVPACFRSTNWSNFWFRRKTGKELPNFVKVLTPTHHNPLFPIRSLSFPRDISTSKIGFRYPLPATSTCFLNTPCGSENVGIIIKI